MGKDGWAQSNRVPIMRLKGRLPSISYRANWPTRGRVAKSFRTVRFQVGPLHRVEQHWDPSHWLSGTARPEAQRSLTV